MKNKVGLSFLHERLEGRSITDVELMVLQEAPERRCLKMAWLCRHPQGNSSHASAPLSQPQTQPRTFESGVPGDQHSGVRKNIPGGILHGKNLSRRLRELRGLISRE